MFGSAITGKSLMEDWWATDKNYYYNTHISVTQTGYPNSITALKKLSPHLSTKLVSLHSIMVMTTMKKLSLQHCLTGLSLQSSLSTSGAIQPSVPGTPDLLLKLWRPTANFLHNPKSEIMARTRPWALGMDTRILWGFKSLWTEEKIMKVREVDS